MEKIGGLFWEKDPVKETAAFVRPNGNGEREKRGEKVSIKEGTFQKIKKLLSPSGFTASS